MLLGLARFVLCCRRAKRNGPALLPALSLMSAGFVRDFVCLSVCLFGWFRFVQAKYQELLPDVSHWQPSPLLVRLAETGETVSGYYAKKAVTSRL